MKRSAHPPVELFFSSTGYDICCLRFPHDFFIQSAWLRKLLIDNQLEVAIIQISFIQVPQFQSFC